MQFRLFDSLTNGNQLGDVILKPGVPVEDGLFQVELDFGNVFNGSPAFLELVIDGSSLSPRQKINAAPLALFALGGNEGPAGAAPFTLDEQTGIISYQFEDRIFIFDPNTAETGSKLAVGNVNNAVTANAGTVAGGGTADLPNTVTGAGGTVSGGAGNSGAGPLATVAGGRENTATGEYNVVGGGLRNVSSEQFSVISGGWGNQASGPSATVSGGERNSARGRSAAIGGGNDNSADAQQSTISGGSSNLIPDTAGNATISGGNGNSAAGGGASIGGGGGNQATGRASTIAGGSSNISSGDNATVSGGIENSATGVESTISGGDSNVAAGTRASVGGGGSNQAEGIDAVVAGGFDNAATGDKAFIGGGSRNIVSEGWSAIVGGHLNVASSGSSFIGAGSRNQTLAGSSAVLAGGSNIAAGGASAIPGGSLNETIGDFSVASGFDNCAGAVNSWAGGSNAKVRPPTVIDRGFDSGCRGVPAAPSLGGDMGTFIWSGDGSEFISQGEWMFQVRAMGGFLFDSTSNGTAGVTLPSGASSWQSVSDRNAKTNIESIDAMNVLARVIQMPIAEYSYKSEKPSVRHMGPMAQDFHPLFGLGPDELRISAMDLVGVSLAAIQGLHAELKTRDRQIAELRSEIERLGSVLDSNRELEERLTLVESVLASDRVEAVATQ